MNVGFTFEFFKSFVQFTRTSEINPRDGFKPEVHSRFESKHCY